MYADCEIRIYVLSASIDGLWIYVAFVSAVLLYLWLSVYIYPRLDLVCNVVETN
jgi:hypothetical protein